MATYSMCKDIWLRLFTRQTSTIFRMNALCPTTLIILAGMTFSIFTKRTRNAHFMEKLGSATTRSKTLGNTETVYGSITLKCVEKPSMTSLKDTAQQSREFNSAQELSESEKLIQKYLMVKFTMTKILATLRTCINCGLWRMNQKRIGVEATDWQEHTVRVPTIALGALAWAVFAMTTTYISG